MDHFGLVAVLCLLVATHRSAGNVIQISCLADFSSLTSTRTVVQCPPGCSLNNANICGTGTYARGRICAAAVHDGKLIRLHGGTVTVTRASAAGSYTGTNRYAVTTSSCVTSTYSYTIAENSASTSFYRRPASGSCADSLTNNVDNCADIPNFCKNQATCINGVNSFTCSCKHGFSGPKCQYNMLDCSVSPCLNSGNCTKVARGVKQCQCVGFFGGVFCDTPLSQCYSGVTNSSIIANSQMTSSSIYGTNWEAFRGRLGDSQCWISKSAKVGEWIEVDFLKPTRISGVITRGRPNTAQWITKYKISYGDLQNNLMFIKDASGADKVFNGNVNYNQDVANHFGYPYAARYWRLTVEGYYGYPTIQLEYTTC